MAGSLFKSIIPVTDPFQHAATFGQNLAQTARLAKQHHLIDFSDKKSSARHPFSNRDTKDQFSHRQVPWFLLKNSNPNIAHATAPGVGGLWSPAHKVVSQTHSLSAANKKPNPSQPRSTMEDLFPRIPESQEISQNITEGRTRPNGRIRMKPNQDDENPYSSLTLDDLVPPSSDETPKTEPKEKAKPSQPKQGIRPNGRIILGSSHTSRRRIKIPPQIREAFQKLNIDLHLATDVETVTKVLTTYKAYQTIQDTYCPDIDLLNLDRRELSKLIRKLSAPLHPDRNPGKEDQFKDLQANWLIIQRFYGWKNS